MLKRNQSGFTVIETSLVLAVSSLLVGIVVAGQTQARVRARFTDGVEKAKNSLQRIQNEAISTYTQGAGRNSNQFFAKRLTFTGDSDTIHTDILLFNPSTKAITVAPSVNTDDIKLPWNIHYVSSGSTGNEILFVRWPTTGTLYTFTPAIGGTFNDTSFNSYDPTVAANRSTTVFQLKDSQSPPHAATISVDGASGAISRTYY